ncbi:NAD(P)-dependent oxidoreductase [bacterium]|nr:NAD(P)-dependent oxidoreductase [bacterium]
MRILVTGSHGLIGSALAPFLRQPGHGVACLVRSDPDGDDVQWDPAAGVIDTTGLEGRDRAAQSNSSHVASESPVMGMGAPRWWGRGRVMWISSRALQRASHSRTVIFSVVV